MFTRSRYVRKYMRQSSPSTIFVARNNLGITAPDNNTAGDDLSEAYCVGVQTQCPLTETETSRITTLLRDSSMFSELSVACFYYRLIVEVKPTRGRSFKREERLSGRAFGLCL